MKSLVFGLTVLCGLYGFSVVSGRRYIAIPIDGLDVLELNQMTSPAATFPRNPRQTETYIPIAVHQEEVESLPRPERSTTTHILDYVDFGGHTGSNGAFSWYADYPAHR
ncbi:uncharacterized protein [Prorops nasuta]|uniref:uncharacterized protein n=1 Tax=Prorops nasuta TaxID=863751 RepID=UPI0034CF3DB0